MEQILQKSEKQDENVQNLVIEVPDKILPNTKTLLTPISNISEVKSPNDLSNKTLKKSKSKHCNIF